MSDTPEFFSKNFVNDGADIVVSSGDATKNRIFDRDTELQYGSLGQTGSTVTIQITFKAGGVELDRVVDQVSLENFNFRTFRVKFGNLGNEGFPTTYTNISTFLLPRIDLIKTPGNEVTASRFLFEVDSTTPLNLEKLCGEIFIGKKLIVLPDDEGFSRFGFDFDPVARVTSMYDDGIVVNQLRWAGNRTERWRGRVAFNLLSKTNYDLLRSVVKNGSFTVRPEPDQRPGEFFQVTHVRGGFATEYSSRFKGAGYALSLNLEED